jgi:serine/threonine protein kinase
MNQCLNPDCLAVNLETHRFCQQCGQKLWLKDRYQALKLIGQGGFGKTFLAIDHDKPSKPQCVIKQFFPQGQGTGGLQKAAELFAEEAKRLDELGKHPQIPELLAYFIHEDQRQYLVQEYIAGQNLEQELKSQGNFNQAKIRALLLDLLPVLDFIHQRQVIHRDIKPENIIRRVQDNKLVLVDFGAAKAVTPVNRSVTGTMIGSAEYVAPEQMNGKAVNASDLYSLGVTCLYLLTGVSPFDLFDAGEHEWFWRDYLVNNLVSDDLGNILDKLVIFGTKRRYQSVQEVLGDLDFKGVTPKTVTQIQVPSPVINIPTSSRPPVFPSSYPQALIETLPGGIQLEMVILPEGTFTMGGDKYLKETPKHQVTLKQFLIGKYSGYRISLVHREWA